MNSKQRYSKKSWTADETQQHLRGKVRQWRKHLFASYLTLIVSFFLYLSIGTVEIAWQDIVSILIFKLTTLSLTPFETVNANIIWEIRLPRILAAIFTGAGLAIAGATMQAILRNPLASPYLLGVSSGASFGAALSILLGASLWAWFALPASAFLGAFAALSVVLLLGKTHGMLATDRLILAGVAVSSLFGALTSFILYISPDKGMREIIFWSLGSFQGAHWEKLIFPFLGVALGSFLFMRKANALNAMLMGEETAFTLGISPQKLRTQLFLVVSIMAGSLVAFFGVIGFVGLMIPHMVRLFIGNDYTKVLTASLVWGGIFMIWTDWIASTLFSPLEIPLGIITALVGAPFFLYLLRPLD